MSDPNTKLSAQAVIRSPFLLVDILRWLGLLRRFPEPGFEKVEEMIYWVSLRVHELTSVRHVDIIAAVQRLSEGGALDGTLPGGTRQVLRVKNVCSTSGTAVSATTSVRFLARKSRSRRPAWVSSYRHREFGKARRAVVFAGILRPMLRATFHRRASFWAQIAHLPFSSPTRPFELRLKATLAPTCR